MDREMTAYLTVVGPRAAGAAEAAELMDDLAQALGQGDREFVSKLENGCAVGAKGLPDLGTLAIKLVEAGSITNLVAALASWLAKDSTRTLKIQLGDSSLEATGLTKDEQLELVKWFQTQAGLKIV